MRHIGMSLAAALLVVMLGACSDDESTTEARADPTPSATGTGPTEPAVDPDTGEPLRAFDATLAMVGQPVTPDQPATVRVTNIGRKADRYLVALTPPGAAFVDPEQIRLAPGKSTVVQVFAGGQGVSIQIYSTGASAVLAQQALPPVVG